MKNENLSEQNSNVVLADIGRITMWKATCQLRWINKEIPVDEHTAKKEKTLQQMWQGDMGEQEWKDIEFAQE